MTEEESQLLEEMMLLNQSVEWIAKEMDGSISEWDEAELIGDYERIDSLKTKIEGLLGRIDFELRVLDGLEQKLLKLTKKCQKSKGKNIT